MLSITFTLLYYVRTIFNTILEIVVNTLHNITNKDTTKLISMIFTEIFRKRANYKLWPNEKLEVYTEPCIPD